MASTSYTAVYNRKPIYRGDTLDGLKITIKTEDDEPVIPALVCCQLRTAFDTLVTVMEAEVDQSTGAVNILPLPPSVTSKMAPGLYSYDLEYTDMEGRVRTYLTGTIEVLSDVSRCLAT